MCPIFGISRNLLPHRAGRALVRLTPIHYFRHLNARDKRGSARLSSSNPLPSHPHSPITSPQQTNLSFSSPYFYMSGQDRLTFKRSLRLPFRDYERQTGKTLADRPLAEKLQSCDSVDSVNAVLREQTDASNEIRGKDNILKPLKNILSVLHNLFSTFHCEFQSDSRHGTSIGADLVSVYLTIIL